MAASKKSSPMDSGNEGTSSEDSNDSNSIERQHSASGSKGEPSIQATDARIAALRAFLRTKVEWTGSDQSFFRVLHQVSPSNYCAIASAMLSKTCQEVSEFCLFISNRVTNLIFCLLFFSSPPLSNILPLARYTNSVKRKRPTYHPPNFGPTTHHHAKSGKSIACG